MIFYGWGKWVETDNYGSSTYELGSDYECVGILAMSCDDEFKYDNDFIKLEDLTRLYRCPTNPKCHFKELIRLFENGDHSDYAAFNSKSEYSIPITHADFPTFLINENKKFKIKLSEMPTEETSSAPIIKKEESYGRRNDQINSICNIAKQLKYVDLMAIPEGGKAAIKTECLKNTYLFTPDGFKKAWQEANKRKLISMQDKKKYLQNQ